MTLAPAAARSRWWLAAAAAALLAALLPARAAAGPSCLRVAGQGQRRCWFLPAGTFGLSWIHSVERTWWRESYRVGPGGGVLLTASDFASAGAGLPDRLGPGERFRLAHGRMRIEGRHVPVGTLRVRLSSLSHHLLNLADRDVDLTSLFGEGLVTIRGEPPTGGNRCACRR